MIEPLEKDEIHSRLSATSGVLHEAYWGRKRNEVLYKSKNPELGPYSPLEILVILQHAAEVFADRVIRMVNGDSVPETRDFDPGKYLSKIDIDDESVKANLRNFIESRAKLFRALFPLKDQEEWDKYRIIHEKYGEINLRQLLTAHLEFEEDLTKKAVEILKEYDMQKY